MQCHHEHADTDQDHEKCNLNHSYIMPTFIFPAIETGQVASIDIQLENSIFRGAQVFDDIAVGDYLNPFVLKNVNLFGAGESSGLVNIVGTEVRWISGTSVRFLSNQISWDFSTTSDQVQFRSGNSGNSQMLITHALSGRSSRRILDMVASGSAFRSRYRSDGILEIWKNLQFESPGVFQIPSGQSAALRIIRNGFPVPAMIKFDTVSNLTEIGASITVTGITFTDSLSFQNCIDLSTNVQFLKPMLASSIKCPLFGTDIPFIEAGTEAEFKVPARFNKLFQKFNEVSFAWAAGTRVLLQSEIQNGITVINYSGGAIEMPAIFADPFVWILINTGSAELLVIGWPGIVSVPAGISMKFFGQSGNLVPG